MSEPLLELRDLSMTFPVDRGGWLGGRDTLTALGGVSLTVKEGETLGIVGESGCGKSTLGRCVLRLLEPTGGAVLWEGVDMTTLSERQMRALRQDMQIIFQDPIASLDPRMTVGQIIEEPLRVFEQSLNRKARMLRVLETMEAVGLLPEMVNRYPHEFSGGQAQRIGIARALITRPRLIICDEPVSALDVSIQAQIVRLLDRLRAEFGLTLLFISHDLSIVRLISDRIMVLYLGQVMEMGSATSVFGAPLHPYTRALLAAAPVPDPSRRRERVPLEGDPPSPINPPSGCPFRTRCPIAEARCAQERPPLSPKEGERVVACWKV